MSPIEYFKLQAKNIFRDYKTKTPYFDDVIGDYLNEYSPQYFDIDSILLSYDWDEDNFSLMKAQHTIALMVGFNKWSALLKASEIELELAKLLFDNQDKINIEDWEMYIARVERDNDTTFDPESKLEIFKQIILNGKSVNRYQDFRLVKKSQVNKPRVKKELRDMTNDIQTIISQLKSLREDGFIFRGHEDFKYELKPSVFRLEKQRQMEKQFTVEAAEISKWFRNKTIIETIDQWAPGVRAIPAARQTIQRLMEFCLYIMRFNCSLNIFAQNNKHRLSMKDRAAILIRDAEFWRQEATFYDMFSRYFPTIVKRYDLQNNLFQDASPYEDLAGVDESLTQHYGSPTAALDWSRNPNVAIHFAIGDKTTEARFLRIYAIKMIGDFPNPPVRIIEKSPEIANLRAERQEGLFTYFTAPCTFFLKHGIFPSIDYFDKRYKNNLEPSTFDLRYINIERTKENIKYLEKLLAEHRINKDYLFPDLDDGTTRKVVDQ